MFWIRTPLGALSLSPEREGRGYEVGYSGGGPYALAEYMHKLIDSNGRDTAVGGLPHGQKPDPRILAWAASAEATHTQELTLEQLKAFQSR